MLLQSAPLPEPVAVGPTQRVAIGRKRVLGYVVNASALASIPREIARKYAQAGVAGIAVAAWHRLFSRQPAIDDFDELHGTDTAGNVNVGALEFRGEDSIHAVRYQTISAAYFNQQLAGLPLPVEPPLTFIDLGSGKGKALMLASLNPRFRRIIGVEYSATLNRIARANVSRFKSSATVELVTGSAGDYCFPAGPLLVYLYNPFDDVVLAQVVERIQSAIADEGGPIHVWYLNPVHRAVLDRVFRVVHDGGRALLYRC